MIIMVLDLRDTKILETISDHARLPYSTIGKKTKISKDSVKARLQRLEQEKYILSYTPLINYQHLGYNLYHVYLRVRSPQTNEQAFLKTLTTTPHIVSVTRTIGKYDYELQIIAKDEHELYTIINTITQPLHHHLNELQTTTHNHYIKYSMKLQAINIPPLNQTPTNITLDEKDYTIIKTLANNCRTPLTTLAQTLNITPEAIRQRLQHLEKNNTILGYYARTNKHRMGLTTYILLGSITSPLTNQEKDFINQQKNIYSTKTCHGTWNIILGFSAKDNKELITTLDLLRNQFNNKLTQYELLILLDRQLYQPFPINHKKA
ncbi:MAG: Lrp/AsnC family transcriptional regulator [Nanoarchaeota archaeon]|nr:Lrp/AsnC family transcriptional regulator [Nanoarchaeota archaeon]